MTVESYKETLEFQAEVLHGHVHRLRGAGGLAALELEAEPLGAADDEEVQLQGPLVSAGMRWRLSADRHSVGSTSAPYFSCSCAVRRMPCAIRIEFLA